MQVRIKVIRVMETCRLKPQKGFEFHVYKQRGDTFYLRGKKCFVLSVPTIDAPIFLPLRQVRDAFSWDQARRRDGDWRNKAYFSFQLVQGDKDSGPVFVNVDVEITKRFLWPSISRWGRLRDFVPTKKYEIVATPTIIEYLTLWQVTNGFLQFVQRLTSQKEEMEACVFGYNVICAIAELAPAWNTMSKACTSITAGIHSKYREVYAELTTTSPKLELLRREACSLKSKWETSLASSRDLCGEDMISDICSLLEMYP